VVPLLTLLWSGVVSRLSVIGNNHLLFWRATCRHVFMRTSCVECIVHVYTYPFRRKVFDEFKCEIHGKGQERSTIESICKWSGFLMGARKRPEFRRLQFRHHTEQKDEIRSSNCTKKNGIYQKTFLSCPICSPCLGD